jgi:serine/threonine-protein kinase
MDLTTGRTQPLVREDRQYSTPRLSPDGRRVAVVIGGADDAQIWVYDIATSTLSQLTREKLARYPEWSADGRDVFYWASEEGAIRVKRLDGSGPARTIFADSQFHYFTLHPDGRTLVYTAYADTGDGRLWMRQFDDSTARLVDPAHSGEWAYRLSPDGRWLAYSQYVSGTSQIFVTPFPGPGPRVQVSAGSGREPVWARDGRSVYYPDGQKIVRATLKFDDAPEVVSRAALYNDTFDAWWDVASYDVGRDGSVIGVQLRKENLQLVVITNWRAELRARLRERR